MGDEELQLVEEYIDQGSWFDEWHTATDTPIDRRAGQWYNFSHFRTPSGLLDSLAEPDTAAYTDTPSQLEATTSSGLPITEESDICVQRVNGSIRTGSSYLDEDCDPA